MSTDQDPKKLTRKELASFLPSERAIRAFEKLFDVIPIDVNSINSYLSSIRIQPVNVSVDYTVGFGNYIVLVDATAGPITITLPDVTLAYTTYNGDNYYFTIGILKIDSSTNAVTVNCQSGQTLFGEVSFDLLEAEEIINVIANPDSGVLNWDLAA